MTICGERRTKSGGEASSAQNEAALDKQWSGSDQDDKASHDASFFILTQLIHDEKLRPLGRSRILPSLLLHIS